MPSQEFSFPIRIALVKLQEGCVVLCLADNEEEIDIDSDVELILDDEDRFRYRNIK